MTLASSLLPWLLPCLLTQPIAYPSALQSSLASAVAREHLLAGLPLVVERAGSTRLHRLYTEVAPVSVPASPAQAVGVEVRSITSGARVLMRVSRGAWEAASTLVALLGRNPVQVTYEGLGSPLSTATLGVLPVGSGKVTT